MSNQSRATSIRQKGALRAHGLYGARQTLRAREAFLAGFLMEADPSGELPEGDRKRRAGYLLRAYMVGLALRRHAPTLLDDNKNAAHPVGGAPEVAGASSRPSTRA